jgi:xanthine dehydrogenase YagR molybdenum-binding subunit
MDRDGRPVNAHMADYLVPVNLDIPQLDVHFVEEEDPHVNPLGVKGLGEIALVGMAPAIATPCSMQRASACAPFRSGLKMC